ncbi:DUF500-domain-containing protein [Anaeromyces robustus]|jgi:lipid-binding SYLF domain-containing protein|uniref:DUF500-domain-containing protein n=1 Tax=Anaeromyces robustus TaxID=1754192 RepID=A0A1Y1XCR9_9FUNG|nr:DUF500-domain-containing protein [Anaeromyces robustus]|eukprot:ORX83539.1 DUF500-domain-containing protein [Anaeromyces robustus]
MPIVEDITNAIKIQIKSLLPVNLDKESEKAEKIIKSFSFDKNDKINLKNPIIAPDVIKKAKGLVILTIGKAGIHVSLRGGSGILISRLSDGTWSAPAAVKTGGFGIGSQIGAEIIELVMVLTNEEAVNNFCFSENLTIGGNLSAAIGTVGRAAEASSSVNNVSAIISYGKSKGAFIGVSVEGAVIQQNNEANVAAYGQGTTVEKILKGDVSKPDFAKPLYSVLEKIEQASTITESKTEEKPEEKTEEKKPEEPTVTSEEKK